MLAITSLASVTCDFAELLKTFISLSPIYIPFPDGIAQVTIRCFALRQLTRPENYTATSG